MTKFVVQIGGFTWLDGEGRPTPYSSQAAQIEEAEAASLAEKLRTVGPAGFAGEGWLPAMVRRAFSIYGAAEAVSVVPAAELSRRLGAAQPLPWRSGSAPAGEAREAAAEPRGPSLTGVTGAIRTWVLAHPEATKKDALAAFPDANPSTVGVQFGAAKKSQQA